MERVLFIDDNEALVAAATKVLGQEFEVQTAPDAEAGLLLLEQQEAFAVVVIDHELPGMSGIEFLEIVSRGWPETERVLVTGHKSFEIAVEALNRGHVARLLPKPFAMDELLQVVTGRANRYDLRAAEQRLTQELKFTRESLLEFTTGLEERLRVQTEQLRGIDQLSGALNAATSLEEIVTRAAESLSRVLGGRGVRLELRSEACSSAGVFSECGPELRGDVESVPVRTMEGEIGRFFVARWSPEGRRLSEEDRRVLATVASATAVAVHNEMRRRQRDEAQHTTVFALARLAEERDNETGMHLERVAQYCRLAACGLREDGHFVEEISDSFIDDLVRSSPLHDIGKVGIPDSILLKPARLTPEEWVTMKQHTTIGADTLRSIIEQTDEPPSFLEMGLQIAWCHHEQWDGSGYPRSLRGELIPLSARILSVADCYDALTTRRPYKDPWSHERALQYFKDKRGSQFDPHVIDAFVKRERLADEIRFRLSDPELVSAA